MLKIFLGQIIKQWNIWEGSRLGMFHDRVKWKYLVFRWKVEDGENYIKSNFTI
jgi:hypothetical protein